MKEDKTIILIGFYLTVSVLLAGSVLSSPPIGCEQFDEEGRWKAWNQGSIANETFFWLEDDKLQLANYDTAFDWVTYSAGFWFTNQAGNNVSIGLFEQDYVEDVSSNNLTWWRGRWRTNFSYGNKAGNLTNRIGQFVNDDFVSYEVKLETNGHPAWDDFNKTINFWRKMSNIDIENNGIADRLMVSVNNNTFDVSLNRTTDTREYLMTGKVIRIYDSDTEKMVEWGMPDNGKYWIKLVANPGGNADVYWWREGIIPSANRTYSLLHYWIDDQYSAGFMHSATGQIDYVPLSITPYTAYITGSPTTQGTKLRFGTQIRALPKFNKTEIKESLPSTAIYSKVELAHFTLASQGNNVDWRTYFFTGDCGATLGIGDWNCGAYALLYDWPNPAPGTAYIDLGAVGLTTWDNSDDYYTVRMRDASLADFSSSNTWSHTIWKMSLRLTYSYLETTIWSPQDEEIIESPQDWVIIGCNATQYKPNNLTIYIDGVANYTLASGMNITLNLSFDYYFQEKEIQCQGCLNDLCDNSSVTEFSMHPLQNVTIDSPLNGTITTETSHNVSCGCSGWPCQYTFFYVNDALNFSGSGNQSRILEFTPGSYNLTCKGYTEYWPDYIWAWNQPVALTITSPTGKSDIAKDLTVITNTEPPCNFLCWLKKLFSRRT